MMGVLGAPNGEGAAAAPPKLKAGAEVAPNAGVDAPPNEKAIGCVAARCAAIADDCLINIYFFR
jgi:hypothetical protein